MKIWLAVDETGIGFGVRELLGGTRLPLKLKTTVAIICSELMLVIITSKFAKKMPPMKGEGHGVPVPDALHCTVTPRLQGARDGMDVGIPVGSTVGPPVGRVGLPVGLPVGAPVGREVGL